MKISSIINNNFISKILPQKCKISNIGPKTLFSLGLIVGTALITAPFMLSGAYAFTAVLITSGFFIILTTSFIALKLHKPIAQKNLLCAFVNINQCNNLKRKLIKILPNIERELIKELIKYDEDKKKHTGDASRKALEFFDENFTSLQEIITGINTCNKKQVKENLGNIAWEKGSSILTELIKITEDASIKKLLQRKKNPLLSS